MATEPAAIRRVRIENFRGFRAEQVIDLAASATIVSGSNGKGKTSFFDALQWLLLGSLSRLADLASRRSGEYIVNSFAQKHANAMVSAELELDGRLLTLTRTGNHKASELQFVDAQRSLTAQEAEKALREALLGDPEMSLKDMVLTSGVLQQDVVRAVLQEEPKNRYRHMASLLGLEEIAGFEAAAKKRADESDGLAKRARSEHATAEAQLRTTEAELARLTQRLASEPEIAEERDKLQHQLAESAPAFALSELPTRAGEAVALAQLARRLRAGADTLLSGAASLAEQQASLPPPGGAEELGTIEREIEQVAEDTAAAQDALGVALTRQQEAKQRASQLAEFATHAMPLLGERCPVCQQSIEQGEVEAHLRELIDAGGEDLPALANVYAEAKQHVSVLQTRSQELQIRRDELRAQARRRTEVEQNRAAWISDCGQLASTDTPIPNDLRDLLAAGDAKALAQLRASADHLAGIAEQLSSLLGTSGLAEEVQRVSEQVATQSAALAAVGDEAARASREAESAKTLASAATRAIAGVTRERFASLQPLVDDIFARLAPHPAFTALSFEMGVAYRAGFADSFVSDPESGVTADPLLVFSSSQANVAALTYFLALSWASTTKALPFLLLDDPLQSMDDVNALGFSDLCRHIRLRRQLVVSTHETRLASLLERKLTPRLPGARTRVLNFTGWDRNGPTIEQRDVETESAAYLLSAS
jgi:DNA repair exonuclease SbcCD ATPase subunit